MLRLMVTTVVLVSVLLAVGGCAASEPTGPEGGSGTVEPTSPPTSSAVAEPGIYELEGGKVQALGTLDYRDIEGGFWAVVDTPIPEEASGAAVVAVIANAEDLGVDLEALRGSYVAVTGTKLDGVSIRQAGPEIEGESIEVVTDTVVTPPQGN